MKLLERLWVAIKPKEIYRVNYIYKHHIFREIGKNVIFVPRVLPPEPEYIKLGDNVVVAARVTFITHDISHNVFNQKYGSKLKYYHGCIEVGNNVFIGSNTTILPNVKIGDNTFIAAGAVVGKDIPGDGVWGGVPAVRIGDFNALYEKRKELSKQQIDNVDYCWKVFEEAKNR